VYHARTKYIDLKFHKIRELVATGELLLEKIHTSENAMDMLTKPVTAYKLMLGLDKCLQVLERRGEDAEFPNLSVPGGGPILDYLQKGEYSPMWRLLEQMVYILLMAH
jgi:hypothetical protein